MKKTLLLVAALCCMVSAHISAQTMTVPTWSSSVACIVYTHCTSCHNSQGIAPFPLTTYAEALPQMQNMKHDVINKIMPPYLPNTEYRKFADMKLLTDDEIQTISDWVSAGGPLGDTTLAPVMPVYTSNTIITNPDLTARIPDYTVPFTGNDVYRCFIITAPAANANYIKSIEVIPGDRSAVHHVLVFQDTSSSLLIANDSADAGPGYTNFGGTGSNKSKLINGWVPGSGVYSTPAGMGIRLEKKSRIVVQIHYPTSAAGKLDSTRINLQYDPAPTLRNVSLAPILNHSTSIVDGPLVIPADSIKTFHEQYTMPQVDVTILGIAPHAHLVCRMMKAYAVTTAGDTIPLIDIPNWDFHWQGFHPFQRPIKIPAGSTVYGLARYDNTYSNPHGPRPLQTVTLGESTNDEMMLFYFSYLPYTAGDENIIVDTASHEVHYLNCTMSKETIDTSTAGPSAIQTVGNTSFHIYPNPAQNILYYESGDVVKDITLTDLAGKTVKQITASDIKGQISISDLSGGLYFVRVQSQGGTSHTERFVKE